MTCSLLAQISGMGMKWNIPRAKCQRPVLSDPPWLEDVKLTPELLYKYQLETKELVDVLRHDMDKLKSVRQVGAEEDLGTDAGSGSEAQARNDARTVAGEEGSAGGSAGMFAGAMVHAQANARAGIDAGVVSRTIVRASTDAGVSLSGGGIGGVVSRLSGWLEVVTQTSYLEPGLGMRPVMVVQTQMIPKCGHRL